MIKGGAALAPRPDPELARVLAPVARRVRARHWLEAGRAGLTWALAWACAVLLAARFLPLLPGTLIGAGVAAALAAWAVLAWRGRPGAPAFAAAADGLGLQERAITALELGFPAGAGAGGTGLAALVRADALARLAALDARRYPLVAGRRAWGHVALLAGMAAVLIWLPNPMAEVAASRAEERAAVRQAGAEAARLQRLAAEEAARTGDRRWREAREILRRLQREMNGSREEALRALAGGKEQVARLARPEERSAGAALSALGQAWRQGALGDAGRALAGRDWRGAREALADLAARAAALSPEAGEALARALQEGAGAARSLPALSEALQRAASAVAAGDGSSAEALSAAAEELATAGELADAAADLDGLLAELDRLAALASAGRGGALASAGGGAAGGTATPARLGLVSGQGGEAGSAGGAGGAPGSGGSGAGAASAGGAGTGGAGQGSGAGQGAGMGAGGGRPGGGGGGMGPGPAGFGASSVGTGEFERIFDPQLLGGRGDPSAVGGNATGASGEQVDAPWSPLGTGALRPYQDVFTRYEADARQSMTRINLPPGLREFVREYFSSLAPADSGGGQGAP